MPDPHRSTFWMGAKQQQQQTKKWKKFKAKIKLLKYLLSPIYFDAGLVFLVEGEIVLFFSDVVPRRP